MRAIIFDFDGVIANSEPLHFRAFREVLADAGVDLSENDYYTHYLGYDDVGVFKALAAERGLTWTGDRVAALLKEKAVRLEAFEREGAILFPGAADAVRRAAALVPTAIASGALGTEIRRILERTALTSCFTAIVSAEDTPVSKPAPDPYLRAVQLLSAACGPLAAGECVALEDSVWGLESARAAGLRTVGVAQTYAADALTADLVIPSIGALDLDALQRLCAS